MNIPNSIRLQLFVYLGEDTSFPNWFTLLALQDKVKASLHKKGSMYINSNENGSSRVYISYGDLVTFCGTTITCYEAGKWEDKFFGAFSSIQNGIRTCARKCACAEYH